MFFHRGVAAGLLLAALCLASGGGATRTPVPEAWWHHARSLKKKDQSYVTAQLVGGGANPYRGRLEVFIKGAWGTVSSESLDAAGVAVLCRQMGLTTELTGQACAPKYFVWDQFRTVGDDVPVYLDELRCAGSEARWEDCKSKGGWKSKYDHTTDVGLQCCEWPGDPNPTVRLVDGIAGVDGRLEVLQGESWGSVCATDFTAVDAQVACNQLGYYDASPRSYVWTPLGPDQTAPPVAMGDVACDGSEGRLEDCPHTGGAGCTGGVVGVACSAQFASATLRLVGGPSAREGRLEILHNGAWGTICDDLWSSTDTRVACKQLDARWLTGGTARCCGVKPGSGIIWLTKVTCSGSENRIENCPPASKGIWGNTKCTHGEDIWIKCNGT